MTLAELLKEIEGKKVKAVQERLKKEPKLLKVSDAGGVLPLHKAMSTGSPGVVEALLGAKADANAPDDKGDTPLHYAARSTGEASGAEVIGAWGPCYVTSCVYISSADDATMAQRPTTTPGPCDSALSRSPGKLVGAPCPPASASLHVDSAARVFPRRVMQGCC